MYCKASYQGKQVFLELTQEQLYGDQSISVDVFAEKDGEVTVDKATLDQLSEIGPE